MRERGSGAKCERGWVQGMEEDKEWLPVMKCPGLGGAVAAVGYAN